MRASVSHKMRRVPTAASNVSAASVWKFGAPDAPAGSQIGWAPLTSMCAGSSNSTMSQVSAMNVSPAANQSRGMKNKGSTINFGDLTPASKMLNRRRGHGVVSRNDLRARKKRYNFLTSERLFGQINRSSETTTFGSKSFYFKENNESHKVHRRILAWYKSRYVQKSKLFPQHLASRIYTPSVMIRSTWGEIGAKAVSNKRTGTMLRSEVPLSKDLVLQAARGAVAKFSTLPEVVEARKDAAKQIIAVAEESIEGSKGEERRMLEERAAAVKKIYAPLSSIDLRKHLFRDESVSRMLGGFQRYVLDYEFCLKEAIEVTEQVVASLTAKSKSTSSPFTKGTFNLAISMAKDLIATHRAKLAFGKVPTGSITNKVLPEQLLTLLVPSCIYVAPFSLLNAANRILSGDPLGMVRKMDNIVDRDLVASQQQFLLMRVAEASKAKGAPSAKVAVEDTVPVIVSDALRLYLQHTSSKKVPSERTLNDKALEVEIESLRGQGYLADCKAVAQTMAAAVAFRHHPVVPDSFSFLPDKDREYRKLMLNRSLLSYTKMNNKTGQAFIRAPSYKVSKDFNTISEFLENSSFVKGTNVLARSTGVPVGDGDSTASTHAYVNARDTIFLDAMFGKEDTANELPRRREHAILRNNTHALDRLKAYEPQYQFFRGLASSLSEAGTMDSVTAYVEENAGALASSLSAEVRYLATLRLNFLALPDARTLMNPANVYQSHARASRERMTGIEFDISTIKIASLIPAARRMYSLRGADLVKSQLPMRPAALMELMLSRQRVSLRKKIVNGIASEEEKALYDALIDVPEFTDLGPMHRGAFTLPYCERLALGEGRKTYRNPFSNYLNFRFGQIREALNEARNKGYLNDAPGTGLPGTGVLTRGIAAEWLQLPQEEKNKFDFTLRQHAFSGAANAEGLKQSVPRPGGLHDDSNHAQFPLVNPAQSNDDHMYDIDETSKEKDTRTKKTNIRLEYEDYLRTGGAPILKRDHSVSPSPLPTASTLVANTDGSKVAMRRYSKVYLQDPHDDSFCPTASVRINGGDESDVASIGDAELYTTLARTAPSAVVDNNIHSQFETGKFLSAVENKKAVGGLDFLSKCSFVSNNGLRAPSYMIQLLTDIQARTIPFYQRTAAKKEGLLLASKASPQKAMTAASVDEETDAPDTFNHVFDSLMETLASASVVNSMENLSADTRYSLKVFTPYTSHSTASVRSIRSTIQPHLQNMINLDSIRVAPKRFVNKLHLNKRARDIISAFKQQSSILFPKVLLKKNPTKFVFQNRKKVALPETCECDARDVDASTRDEPVVPALLTTNAAHLARANFREQLIATGSNVSESSPVAKLFQPGSATASLTAVATFASTARHIAYHTSVITYDWTSPGVRTVRIEWPNADSVEDPVDRKSLVGMSLPTTLHADYNTMISDIVVRPRSNEIVPMSLWSASSAPAEAADVNAYEGVIKRATTLPFASLMKKVTLQMTNPSPTPAFPPLGGAEAIRPSTNVLGDAIGAVVDDPALRPVVASVPLVTEEERAAAEGTGRRFLDFATKGRWSPSSVDSSLDGKKAQAPKTGVEKAFTSARRRVEAMLYFPDPLAKLRPIQVAPPLPKAAMEVAMTNKKLLTKYWPSDSLVISSRVIASKDATRPPATLYLADQAVCEVAHREITKADRRNHSNTPLTNTALIAYPSEGVVSRAADAVINYIGSKGLPSALPTNIYPLLHANSLISSDFDDRQQIRDIRSHYVFPEMPAEMEEALVKQRAADRATKEEENFTAIMQAMSAVASDAEAHDTLARLDDAPPPSEEDVVESIQEDDE